MKIGTLTIVGVGLIGGSIGLAAKQRNLAGRVLGVGRRSQTLEQALSLGIIDEGFLDLQVAARQADLVVFCTPVDQIVEQVLMAAQVCPAEALLTDAGSTKATIVRRVETGLTHGATFVGSHPLAGSEKRGPEYAEEGLFQNRLTVVTRTSRTPAAAVARTTAFWQALGSRTRVMDPEEHDRALAQTSHFPHLMAAVLSGTLGPDLYDLTATGFRDTTRVAAGDPTLWTAILAQNRDAVLEAMQLFDNRLGSFRQALVDGDWLSLETLLNQAKKVRDALGNCHPAKGE